MKERTIHVADFITDCVLLAQQFIPGQKFDPLSKFRIWAAMLLDKTAIGRFLFQFKRKL
jgi:hypothetical protein